MNILFGKKKKTGKTEYASVNEVWIKLLDGWQVMWVLKKEQAFWKDQYLTKSVKEQACIIFQETDQLDEDFSLD